MSSGEIKKVGMLVLMQNDLNKGVEFYKKLGLTLKFQLKDKWAEFRLGDIKIGLCPTKAEPFNRHSGIVLEVDDLSKTFKNLHKKGIEFVREPVEATHGVMASIKDPSGNILDLYQPTPEKVAELVKKVKQEEEKSK